MVLNIAKVMFKVTIAVLDILEARITHLSYDPEIATAVIQKNA